MTNEDFARQTVRTMIDRLRELQGTGEYVPLTTQVRAGTGLSGGGQLLEDVTLSLDEESISAIQRVVDAQWLGSAAPTVDPVADRLALRSDVGNVRTGAPVDPADAVPLSRLNSEVSNSVRQVSGQTPIRVSVVNESSHNQNNEVNGVLYIILGD